MIASNVSTPASSAVAAAPAGMSVGTAIHGALATASMAACLVHGYRRNNGSLGWGLAWAALGSVFPVVTPAIAVAQGFGKPLPSRTPESLSGPATAPTALELLNQYTPKPSASA